MIKEHVTLDETISFLNELLLLDATAISNLMATRQPCNNPLSNHQTVQVAYNKAMQTNSVGCLGLLNGVFGKLDTGKHAGFGAIATLRDEKTNQIIRFIRGDQLEQELEKNAAPR